MKRIDSFSLEILVKHDYERRWRIKVITEKENLI